MDGLPPQQLASWRVLLTDGKSYRVCNDCYSLRENEIVVSENIDGEVEQLCELCVRRAHTG